MKKLVLGISGGISFLLFLILTLAAGLLGKDLDSQTMAERWSRDGKVSQVSCFFSVNAQIDENQIKSFEHSIDGALADAAVQQESENPGARLWVDAYSADGKITVSSDRSTLDADAIGIGGDFFLFHPLKLLSGSYFSGNDLMQDYCVIDQDAAWQLFGSNDVAGMMVYINGVPHIVSGVVQREEGLLTEAAGLDSTLIYVSYQTLSTKGRSNGINHYEIVMPNPISHFAYNYVSENLGYSEKEAQVVENSERFSFLSRLKLIPQFGTRSMNGKAIIYPYWENVARGYEDILALITLGQMVFLIYAAAVALGFFIFWWRHKGWTVHDKWLVLKDKGERLAERSRAKHRARKGNPDDLEFLTGFGAPEESGESGENGGTEKKVFLWKREKPLKEEKAAKREKPPKAEKAANREKSLKEEKAANREKSLKEEKAAKREKPPKEEKAAKREKPLKEEKAAKREKPSKEEKAAEREKLSEEKTSRKERMGLGRKRKDSEKVPDEFKISDWDEDGKE
ncbi:MAG: ABC transporter permease [bacterium]|nr:ABC transporter permease [bacterium]